MKTPPHYNWDCVAVVLRYFIINGEAEVLIGDLDDDPVVQLKKGSFFGEMALLREEVRSAWVRAATEMDLFVLAKPDLRAVIDEEPHLEDVLVEAMKARQPGGRSSPDDGDDTCRNI